MPKILFIEDGSELLDLYESFLQKEGMEVVSLHGNEDDLEKALSDRPDLVLMDFNGKEFDSFQVLLRIKADKVTASIPVVVMTHFYDTKDHDSCIYVGASQFLATVEHKPEEVVGYIKQLVSAKLPKSEI